MTEYLQVAKHLGVVRRAWKRAAALAGLAIVCIEAVGLLTVALLIDWIYQPMPAVRLGIFLAVLAVVAVLLSRHVLAPLFRRISDDQLAMFVEEHSERFEGALITAAELNAHPDSLSPTPRALVDAVMNAAAARAGQSNIRSVVDVRRLRKYGVAAVVLLAGYGAVCLAFPSTIGRHASRVLAPWQQRAEDQRHNPFAAANANVKLPIQFTLSRGDGKMLRRSTFELQAGLSRAGDGPVVLNFRPANQPNLPWRQVTMKEIERVNSFTGAISDVDEDLEFSVSCGADQSTIHKVTVFDPLKIEGFEITTEYPAYLELPSRVEVAGGGDIAAPVGSKITLKMLASAPLTQAVLTWQPMESPSTQPAAGPAVQAMTVRNQEKGTATASFVVTRDTAYTYAAFDDNGQKEENPVGCIVRALADGPPVIEVKYPQGPVMTHPLGEITFAAEAVDDLALAGVELVYERHRPMGPDGAFPPAMKPVRVPLKAARPAARSSGSPFPDAVQGSLRFALEDLQPPAAPEEIISYYIQAVDRKGQAATTDIHMIVVDRFDAWPTFSTKVAEETEPGLPIGEIKNIEEYLQATWKLEGMKPTLAKEDHAKQSKELAATMIDPQTRRLYPFYDPKKINPDKMVHAERADKFIAAGHGALERADTARAASDFSVALAELTICGMGGAGVKMFDDNKEQAGEPGAPKIEKDLKKLFEAIKLEADQNPPPGENQKQAKAIEKIKKAAEELAKQQSDIVKKAEQIAEAAGEHPDKPRDVQADNEDKDKAKAKAQAEKDAKDLAAKQEKVAADTRKEALENKAKAPADSEVKDLTSRMEDAAKTMRDVQRNLQENKLGEAVADARRAQAELQKVAQKLENLRQEKLAGAIAETEARAAKLLKGQKEVSKDTDAAAKADPKRPEDQKDRDFKKLAHRQARLQSDAEQLKKDVQDLKNAAERDAKAETAKHIDETNKELVRGEVDQKMVNAVVELESKNGESAKAEQKKAEKALEGALAALRKAGDSLAADRESQLHRAKEEARRIEEGLVKLGAEKRPNDPASTTRPTDDKTAKDKPTDDKTAKDKPTDDKTAKDKPTDDKTAKDKPTDDKTAKDKPTDDKTAKDKPTDDKTAKDKPTDDKTAKDKPTDDKTAKDKPMNDKEKKELAEDVADEIERLARHLEDRDFADKPDQQYMARTAQKAKEGGSLTEEMLKDRDKRQDLVTVVRRVRDRLEGEYRSQLEARKILDAQREECPPGYRRLVDKYYEALAEKVK